MSAIATKLTPGHYVEQKNPNQNQFLKTYFTKLVLTPTVLTSGLSMSYIYITEFVQQRSTREGPGASNHTSVHRRGGPSVRACLPHPHLWPAGAQRSLSTGRRPVATWTRYNFTQRSKAWLRYISTQDNTILSNLKKWNFTPGPKTNFKKNLFHLNCELKSTFYNKKIS